MVSASKKSDNNTIYTWLEKVKERPDMFFQSLGDLECTISGYYTALQMKKIVENVPPLTEHFRTWLRYKTGWSMSCGWAYAIEENIQGRENQRKTFFYKVAEYQQLIPIIICSVSLLEHHVPTGKRIIIGTNGRMNKPQKIDIMSYQTSLFHFLRFHYEDSMVDSDILMKTDGTHDTTIEFAKLWVKGEFQVKDQEWNSQL
tara:strand:- start:6762 stop:7364 length:603 start_codon:yes stop_codon:yes gene_type:complete